LPLTSAAYLAIVRRRAPAGRPVTPPMNRVAAQDACRGVTSSCSWGAGFVFSSGARAAAG